MSELLYEGISVKTWVFSVLTSAVYSQGQSSSLNGYLAPSGLLMSSAILRVDSVDARERRRRRKVRCDQGLVFVVPVSTRTPGGRREGFKLP